MPLRAVYRPGPHPPMRRDRWPTDEPWGHDRYSPRTDSVVGSPYPMRLAELLSVSLTSLVALPLARQRSQPLRRLRTVLAALGAGNLGARVGRCQQDEL